MGRRNDNAPIGHTCPIIDGVISEIHSIYQECDDFFSKGAYISFEKGMEQIRTANSTLREWGNEQYNRADDLENDLDDANRTISRLEDELESLKNEIKQLEKDLEEAQKENNLVN